jgi:single-stranded-DNA-specific exonuclease
MYKKWTLKPAPAEAEIEALRQQLNISKATASLLINRGIKNYDDAKIFFVPELSQLHTPWLLKDMQLAVERIVSAINNGEKIIFFGDYDVDGTTSVAMMYSFFRDELHYPHIMYYIPDRYTEGYGMSTQGIDVSVAQGASLMITLDCGIKSPEKVKYAAEKKLDVIICDHHIPGEEIPKAVAILNPKQEDCNYPNKNLSGCGVAFKLLQALIEKLPVSSDQLMNYLDLVAVSTSCDIVQVTGENRVLVTFGLKKLNENPRPGIRAIRNYTGINIDFTLEDVVFTIGPRINAAGRIKHGSGAVDLLISQDGDENVQSLLKEINEQNTTRKGLDKKITEEALHIIQNDDWFATSHSHVVHHPEWHKGVVGIVASRIIENHYKPTIVLTSADGVASGSARSVKGVDVHAAIEECADLLHHFGGHTHAAGLSLPIENIDSFKKKFDQAVDKQWPAELRIPEIEVDEEIPFTQINRSFFDLLSRFAPFGPGNMDPIFMTRNVRANNWSKIVGDIHLKLYLNQDGIETPSVGAIAFKQARHFDRIKTGEPFHIVYNLKKNEWNGKVNIELDIKDIHFD